MSAAERKKRSAGELDDLLKQRNRTILDLRQEAEGREALVAELREHMQDAHELINSWILAYPVSCQSRRRVGPITAVESFVLGAEAWAANPRAELKAVIG
jgi:hypothetical protein